MTSQMCDLVKSGCDDTVWTCHQTVNLSAKNKNDLMIRSQEVFHTDAVASPQEWEC